MAKKKFVLRIDESTMKSVEKWAADEFRSTNGQLEWIITQGLKRAKRYKSPTKENVDTIVPKGETTNQVDRSKN